MAKTRQFGNTWWGRAWLEALERRALVDPNRLPRGRTYARQDRVRALELSPGRLQAIVHGSRIEPYTTTLSLRQLSESEWDHVLEVAMDKASNVAGLLAGEVPPEIGVLVLPGRGELGPACSCPDWAEPCKHAAALCYVAADLFDEDPFALLMLRGRSRQQILQEVRARRSDRLGVSVGEASDQPRGPDPTMSAAKAFRRSPTPLETSPPVPARPGVMPGPITTPGADTGVDVDELRALARDAAERAWAMLVQGDESGLGLSVGADVARRAARGDVAAIASATGVDPVELANAAAAWRVGGLAGYQALRGRPEVDATALERGVAALGHDARIRANAVSLGDRQLRLDEHGSWWRFASDDELGWTLVDGPATDPGDLV